MRGRFANSRAREWSEPGGRDIDQEPRGEVRERGANESKLSEFVRAVVAAGGG